MNDSVIKTFCLGLREKEREKTEEKREGRERERRWGEFEIS